MAFARGFDFGAGHPLPPPRARPFRSFARDANPELLDYLDYRNISVGFLYEIDSFLAHHPELAHHLPAWAADINQANVVFAYRIFMQGWTRPARARNLPSLNNIPLPLGPPRSITTIYDIELQDFFAGYEIRNDMLQRIDREVAAIVQQMRRRRYVAYPARRLAVLALYGNPIDCYRYFEYSYQTDHQPHRYLPEHVRLLDIPKPKSEYDAKEVNLHRHTHLTTRIRISRAQEAGVPATRVLLHEFTALLCRRGLRRNEIEGLVRDVEHDLSAERQIPVGEDIVDVVMNKAGQAVNEIEHARGRLRREMECRMEALRQARRERAARAERRAFRKHHRELDLANMVVKREIITPEPYTAAPKLSKNQRKKARRRERELRAARFG